MITHTKVKPITKCTKCGKKMRIPEEDCTKEKIKTLNFLCSDCTHAEILEKELKLEKEIISKLGINPEKKYNTTATAKILGISSPTVLREIKKGKIKFTTGKGKIRPQYRISGKELIEYAKIRHKRQGGAYKSPGKRSPAQIRAKYP